MATKKLVKYRIAAFNAQGGRCYYCNCPIWESDPDTFAKRHNLTYSQALALQSTAEHLLARQDGGKDKQGNVVAACRTCNQGRHKRKKPFDPLDAIKIIRQRIAKGGWHSFNVNPLLTIA